MNLRERNPDDRSLWVISTGRVSWAALVLLLAWQSASATEIPFASQSVIPTSGPGQPGSVFAADIDGDGDLDLLTATFNELTFPPLEHGEIAWYENTTGDGSTWLKHSIDSGAAFAFSGHAAAADVDGDGDLDALVVSTWPDDEFSWYENTDGSGSFGSANVATDPSWFEGQKIHVVPADIDGDDDLDALIARGDPTDSSAPLVEWPDVVWAENTDGDGTFTLHTVTTLMQQTRSVFAADMDGDGDLDALTGSRRDDEVAWFENDGMPAYWDKHSISTTRYGVYWVAGGDIDGDGDIDALASSQCLCAEEDEIAWHENASGDGTIWVEHTISSPDFSVEVKTEDMDGDGDLDVVAIPSSDNTVTWYENTDGVGLIWVRRFVSTTVSGRESVTAGDLDGDGDRDVIWASFNDTVAWHENLTIHRSASFSEQNLISSTADYALSVFAADLDGDGDADVLSASKEDDKVAWYENNGAVPPELMEHVITEDPDGPGGPLQGAVDFPTDVFAADVDGDGDIDVLTSSGDDDVSWFENTDGDGTFGDQLVISNSGDLASSVYAADLDRDGDVDVLASSESDDRVAWYENLGRLCWDLGPCSTDPDCIDGDQICTNRFAEHVITVDPDGPGGVEGKADRAYDAWAADLDGDGDLDVLSASTQDNKVAWYENRLNEPSASFGGQVVLTDSELFPLAVRPADLDGDGDVDVLAPFAGSDEVVWYPNSGAGGFGAPRMVSEDHDYPMGARAADFDGDGDLDVVASSRNDDEIAWYENTDGAGSFGSQRLISTSALNPRRLFTVDLDGDGDLDLLSSSWDDDEIAWYENRGGQFSLPTTGTGTLGIPDGAPYLPLTITATHNGRAGDTDLELDTLELLFEEGPGDPLSSAEANAIIDRLRIHVDDGSRTFDGDPPDTLVKTVETLSLTAGAETVTFANDDPRVQISQGTPRAYFVVLDVAADASAQTINSFQVTHLTESTSTALDRDADIPLTLEFAANATAGPACFGVRVISVLPFDNALETQPATDVTVFFSEPVDPATVTTTSFRLLNGATPVPATMSVSPTGLEATLDPLAPLAFDTLYTVNASAAILDLSGCALPPLVSRFRTEDDPVVVGTLIVELADRGGVGQPFAPGPSAPLGSANEQLGFSAAHAGDVTGDGLMDAIAGRPGSDAGKGTVTVFYGSTVKAEREEADLLFLGESAGDRVGEAVAGGFDFNGNGMPDLLIGAPDADGGQGRVYLVFDVEDYDDSAPGSITQDLSEIGDYDDVTNGKPGVVFTGGAAGDAAGFALAVGSAVQSGASYPTDLLIGSPGYDEPATTDDRGAAYVVFGGTQWTAGAWPSRPTACPSTGRCEISLACVATSCTGDQIAGIVYKGAQAGDALGHAVAFPGDIAGTGGHDDIALGAPLADPPGFPNAGTVYVIEGGDLTAAAPAVVSGIEIRGDRTDERLGFSVAGGGDHRNDDEPDLLIGAPFFDLNPAPPLEKWGRVIQTSARLEQHVSPIAASTVGTAVDGVRWVGQAADDQLGFWVAGVGDVTGVEDSGDGPIDDIVLGAPYSDPRENLDAGTAYLIKGPARTGRCSVSFTPCGASSQCPGAETCDGGVLSVGLVEGSIAGFALVAEHASDNLGYSIAATGPLDEQDLIDDFVVGGPLYAEGSGEGVLYLMVGVAARDPGTCEADKGCTVVDLATGAQIFVPPDAIQEPIDAAVMTVKGALAAGELSAFESAPPQLPAGLALAGAADFRLDGCPDGAGGVEPCAVAFGTGLSPTITLPWNAEVFHVVMGESLPLLELEGATWSPSVTGQVTVNPQYPAQLAVQADLCPGRSCNDGSLKLYAAAIVDVDGDGYRPAPVPVDPDCDDSDATVYPGAPELCDGKDNDCAGDPVSDESDDDGDGYVECADWVGDGGILGGEDCNDADHQVWRIPGQPELWLDPDRTTLTWSVPDAGGWPSALLGYDVIRSDRPDSFAAGTCVESDDGTNETATDSSPVPAAGVFYYLVRAENICGGDAGQPAGGPPRDVRNCP